MIARTKLGIEVLAAGAVLGVIGDAMLRAEPWGLNVTLCALALTGAATWLVRRNGITPGPDAPWLALTVVLLGAAFMRRDAAGLERFDVIGMIIALALGAASLQGAQLTRMRPSEYVRAGVMAAGNTIVGGFMLIGQDVAWRELPMEGRWRHARAVALGALLAAPLLVVFGSLFASADSIFSNVLQNVFAFDVNTIASHMILIAVWGALTAGYLRWSLLARPDVAPASAVATASSVGIVPVGTALGLINLMFLLFVVVQLRYFFGGAALVEQSTGLTYAEYARQGFFQLMAASGLVLPVLMGANHLVRGETPVHLTTFRRLASLLLVLLAVVMASALQRMRLYVGAFGLSEDRLYATAFMVYLLGVFAWFGWTVLRGRPGPFAFGAFIHGFAVLAGLHVVNPDALIVRTNLNRPATERPFDAKYALSLGADAAPILLEALPRLDAQSRCLVATKLLAKWGSASEPDWRTWNWSRSRARRLVTEQADALRALRCPENFSSSE
jgi:Domain of unknown function (DUF4173)